MRSFKGIFLLCLIVAKISFCQRLGFKNFSTENGLSADQVLCLYQDPDNKMWIGSTPGGVDIYNGYEFKRDSSRLKLKTRTVFHIDRQGNDYFFSTNNGLKIFSSDSTTTFDEDNGLKSFRVFKTFKDSKGITWIATEKGIQQYEKGKIVNPNLNSAIDTVSIFNIKEDSKGNIWFCTLFNGLYKYDRKTVKHFSIENENGYKFIADILELGPNSYWVSTRGGLYSLDGVNMTKIKTPGPGDTQFYGMLKDSKNNIWIGSDEGALVYRNNTFTRITTKNGLTNNSIWNIYEDNENTLWFISNKKGISQLNSERFSLFDKGFLNIDEIHSITPKNDSILYLGTRKSLVEFNINSHNKRIIHTSSEDNIMYNVSYDRNIDEIIIGQRFLGKRIKKGELVERFTLTNQNPSFGKIWKVFKDKNRKIWLGTASGIANIVDSEIIHWDHANNIKTHVFDILEMKDGKMFFATEIGLFLKDGNKLSNISKEQSFSDKRIRQLAKDKRGNIWIASADGLFKYDGIEFEKVNFQNVKDDVILSLAFDKSGNLWAALPSGALKIKFADGLNQYTFYTQKEGFIGRSCNNKAIWVSPNNEVYFGTNSGLVVYHPTKDHNHKNKPNLKVHMKVRGLNDLSPYCDGFDDNGLPINLILPNNFTEISFENQVTSLRNSGRIELEYKLVDDHGWNTSFNDIPVVYSMLPSGKNAYLIRVKQNNNFKKTPPIIVSFEILKPFYLRWWFILICIGVAGTWIYSYTLINRNVKALNRQKAIILKQKAVVEEKNREVTDSITYAKRIQDTILPQTSNINDLFSECFVLYNPRDIVSGDFYWVERQDDWIVFAAADCTGHGVPGAMVSIMCSNLLRKAIVEEKIDDPAKALDLVSDLLLERMNVNNEKVDDGMDISLCYWNPKTNQLKFAGAHNPLYLIRNQELLITKGDKQPIGYFEDRVPFTCHELEVKEGDQIILFSDGLKDQFGGPKNKKYSTKRFKNILTENASLPLEVQEENLQISFQNWKGNEEQVDDVCVFSVKLSRKKNILSEKATQP